MCTYCVRLKMFSNKGKTKKVATRKAADRKSGGISKVAKAQTSRTSKIKSKSDQAVMTKSSSTTDCQFSILHYLTKSTLGGSVIPKLRDTKKDCIISQVSRFQVLKAMNAFERRVTAIAWHPTYSQIAAAGSKGGELSWYNLKLTGAKSLPGIGPGGSIVGLKFHRDNPCLVYTASITGDVKQVDFNQHDDKVFLSMQNHEQWFSSLDVCFDRKIILAGDTSGYAHLTTTDGNKVWNTRKRLHKAKISHLEFSTCDSDMFVTASLDRSVKLWDLRMMTDAVQPISVFLHRKGVNSAYFSPSNRHSLLTTDQHSEIRVYRSVCWNEDLIIPHPHRQFQHLTPIKATWHPMEDIFIVGRYPDDAFLINDDRTLDFYDGSSGTLLHRKIAPTRCISNLNAFNIGGDAILSGTGSSLVFWKDQEVLRDYKS